MIDPFACRIDEYALERACAPEQPAEVAPGQEWMDLATGQTYPVVSVRDDVIQRGDLLVRLGSASYAILLSASGLRERYVCVDQPEAPDVGRIY